MERPKADITGSNAKERLSNAFWSMLSEMDFFSIRVDELKVRAKVNHNTFYYYRNLEDMACVLVKGSASAGIASSLVPLFSGYAAYGAEIAIGDDAANALCVARHGSRLMVDLMCSTAMEAWLEGGGD